MNKQSLILGIFLLYYNKKIQIVRMQSFQYLFSSCTTVMYMSCPFFVCLLNITVLSQYTDTKPPP